MRSVTTALSDIVRQFDGFRKLLSLARDRYVLREFRILSV